MKKFTSRKSHYLFIITAFLMGGLLSVGYLAIQSHLPIYAKTISIGQPVTLTGTNTLSAPQFIDTANSAYFLDPAASGTSLSLNGTAAVSGLNLGGTAITATGAELNYVHGVTSALQTQLGLKAPLASPTFTGTVTIPTPVGDTAAATKAYVDAAGGGGGVLITWANASAAEAWPAAGLNAPACPTGWTQAYVGFASGVGGTGSSFSDCVYTPAITTDTVANIYATHLATCYLQAYAGINSTTAYRGYASNCDNTYYMYTARTCRVCVK